VLRCELELQHQLTPFDAETYERKLRSAMRGRVSNKTYVSDITISLPAVYDAFQRVVLPYAKRVIELKRYPVEQNAVAHNLGACDEYGGCQRKAICPRYQDSLRNPQPDSDWFAVDTGDTMSLDLFGSLTPPAPQPQPAAAPPAATPTSNVMDLFGSLSAPANTTAPAAAPVTATPINGPAASTETIVVPAGSVAVDAEREQALTQAVMAEAAQKAAEKNAQRGLDYENAKLGAALRVILRAWRNG
jgi:hypothetical protein